MNRNKFKLSPYYFIVAAIFSAVFFFLLLENYKVYRTQISFIFIPQSEKIITQTNSISENLVRLPKKLAFYEKILADSQIIKDEFAGLSPDERKKQWNDNISVRRENGSTIFDISVTSKNSQNSIKLARQSVYSLFDTLSHYYDVKKDIDLRIIDGPITAPYARGIVWLILLSVTLGLAASFLLFLLFFFWDNFVKLPRVAKIPSKLPVAKNKPSKEKIPSEFEKLIAVDKKAAAPVNLPTVEDIYPNEDIHEDIIYPEMLQMPKEPKATGSNEPTEEELKERLNQLLRGEL